MPYRIKRITNSPPFTLPLAISLIAYSLYDLYEEFLDPVHEHVVLFIAVLMTFSACRELFLGINTITHLVRKKKITRMDMLARLLDHRWTKILLALVIIITSCYGLYKDVSEIMTKSLCMTIGLIMILIVIINSYEGLKELTEKSGIDKWLNGKLMAIKHTCG